MARPRLDTGLIKERMVKVRVSAAQMAAIDAHAKAAGTSRSAYVLAAALGAGTPVLSTGEHDLLRQCGQEMRRIGSALTLLAREVGVAAVGRGQVSHERVVNALAEIEAALPDFDRARLPIRRWLDRRESKVGGNGN